MAIDNPAAVRYCNEQIRTFADDVARVSTRLQRVLADFSAKGLDQFIPDDPAETVIDGSDRDGRTPITGHDVHEMLAVARDLQAMASGANTRMPTVYKVAVNP